MCVTKSVNQPTHSHKVAENINVPEWRHGDRGQWKIRRGKERRQKAEGKKFATAEFARGEIISGPFLRPCSVDMDWRDRVGGRSGGGQDERNYFAW